MPAIAWATKKSKQFSLNNADKAAAIEEAAQKHGRQRTKLLWLLLRVKNLQRFRQNRLSPCPSQQLAVSHTLRGKAEYPARDEICPKWNRKGNFQEEFLTQKRVGLLERHSESDDSDAVASLCYERHQRGFILAKVISVSRQFLVDSGSDNTVVELSVAKICASSPKPKKLARSETNQSTSLALRQHKSQVRHASGRKLFS